MMRPQFDEADLALLEVSYDETAKSETAKSAEVKLIVDLIREVRIYQDLLATKQAEFDFVRDDCECDQ